MAGSALSYSKWDHIEDSDDELEAKGEAKDGKIDALLESKKRNADRDSDNALAQRFLGYMKEHVSEKAPIPREFRDVAARFVGVTDKRDQASNSFRYSDIVACGTRYQKELVNREMVDALCELHKMLVDSTKDMPKSKKEPLLRDVRTLMEAINTLEALRTHDNAAHFFEQVCSPSSGESARKLCETYQKGEFAKRAMLRYLFAESEFGGEMERIIDEDAKGKPKASGKSADETEQLWTIGLFGLVLAALVGGVYYAFFAGSAAPAALVASAAPEEPDAPMPDSSNPYQT